MHWIEYACEAGCLGLFMVSACGFVALLEHPGSPARRAIGVAWVRRLLIGIAMGATAAALITSPMGMRSGAHMNPAFTFTMWRLGKVGEVDAAMYVLAQFVGAAAGVGLVRLLMPRVVGHANVGYVATRPRSRARRDVRRAAGVEVAMAALLMSVALWWTNDADLAGWTPFAAAGLVATFIFVAAPISGMSINPARTFGSAAHARRWDAWWVYALAPLVGMLLAAEGFGRFEGFERVLCAKWRHPEGGTCIFECRHDELRAARGDLRGLESGDNAESERVP